MPACAVQLYISPGGMMLLLLLLVLLLLVLLLVSVKGSC
jgi:hypothetical protein